MSLTTKYMRVDLSIGLNSPNPRSAIADLEKLVREHGLAVMDKISASTILMTPEDVARDRDVSELIRRKRP